MIEAQHDFLAVRSVQVLAFAGDVLVWNLGFNAVRQEVKE